MARPNPFAKTGAKGGSDPVEPDADDRSKGAGKKKGASGGKAASFGGKKANPFGAGADSAGRSVPKRSAGNGAVPSSKRPKY